MPSATVSQQMPVPSAEVFKLLHDYGRRLEWDTLLKEARLTQGHTEAGIGATSLCVGKPFFGIFGIETRYVTFDESHIAAVTMINSPPLFATFAASIRHEDNAQGSTITYKLRFTAKPRAMRWLLEPIMLKALQVETAKRLCALADFLGCNKVAP
jgi:hypothetical protein